MNRKVFRNYFRAVLMNSKDIAHDVDTLLSEVIKGKPQESRESKIWIILREFEKLPMEKTDWTSLNRLRRIAEPKQHIGSGSRRKPGTKTSLNYLAYGQLIKAVERKLECKSTSLQPELFFGISIS